MTDYRDSKLESDSNIKPTTDISGSHPTGIDPSAPPTRPGSSDSSKGGSIDPPLSQRRRK